MSKIEELINKLCPNGVEYKTIGEICNNIFSGGTPKTSNDDYYGGNIPWLRSGEINFNEIKDAEIKITEKGLNESSAKWIKSKSVLIALTGATVARCAVNEIALTANQSVCAMEVSDKVNYKFLYYTIANKYNEIKGMAQGALTSINLNIIKSIKVAVPPMEVQNEIVHILDDFTLLSAELSAELKARQKQYEYYKENLLSFSKTDENINWITLGSYCKRLKGTAITAGKMKEIANDNGNVKIFAGGKTMIYTDENNIPKEDIIKIPNIIVQSRGIIDFIYYDKPCSYKREMWSYTIENEITLKYIYYYLKNNVEYFRQRGSQMGSMPQISLDVTEKYKIPMPDLNEQKRIVDILERFDKFCNDITEGLPAEIDARKKQYEYYRNKLLNFKELKVEN